jgi:membrane protease YdiL (CAAX protease family)
MNQTLTLSGPVINRPGKVQVAAWIALVCIYIVVRFLFTKWLDSIGNYASYIFEVVDVTLAAFLAGRSLFDRFNVNKLVAIGMSGSLLGGFAIFKFAGLAGIAIPFDLTGAETIVFLLIVAPILEESLFRFFIWEPLSWLFRPVYAWVFTSLIFSYSHLHAIWFVPKEIQLFVIYQTVYTLGLGLASGFFVFRFRSILGAMAIHFSFNLGFYFASLL